MSIGSRITKSFQYLIRGERRPRPDAWDDLWFERQPTENSSGIAVDEDKALTYFAVWACRKVISEDMGSLPLFIYRRDGTSKQKDPDHPLYRLLHDSPNDEMTAMNLRETMQNHVLGFGNAYAEVLRNMRGQVLSLWPLNPSPERMRPQRDSDDRLIYEYRTEDGQPKTFQKQDIFHLAGLGFNGLVGYSPIKYWAETIGVGLSEQIYQGANYRNGARLSMAITHPAAKGPDAEGRATFRNELNKQISGQSNTGKCLVLWEGMKAEPMSMTMEDAQIIESRKLTWLQICAIHRVPPHKVMNLFHATFSNIENQDIDYAKSTIRPWCVRWEQAINMRLLDGSAVHFAEHNLDGLMRGDILSRYQAYAIARRIKMLNANECRAFENLNPYEGGDVYENPDIDMTLKPLSDGDADSPVSEEEKERAARAIRHLRLIRGQ